MGLLFASLAVLALGPPLHVLSRGRPALRRFLDGFVLIGIGGLVLFHILPETYAAAGWPVIPAVAIGLLGPGLFEKSKRTLARRAHGVAVVLALLGSVIHGMIDGFWLAPSDDPHLSRTLGVAVILHRIPVGLAVWWLVRPRWGRRGAVGFLLLMAGATLAGFLGAEHLDAMVDSREMAIFGALVAGSLLHVVGHRPHDEDEAPRAWHVADTLGAVGAVLLVVALQDGHAHHHHAADAAHAHHDHAQDDAHTLGQAFLELALESAPALLLAYLLAGVIQVFLPKASVGWISRGGNLTRALRGVAFGLPLPICSCGVVPVYRSLAKRGVAASAGLAFLVATPELGIDAILLSIPLLGGEMTLVRVGAAALVAVVVGWLVGRTVPALIPSESEAIPGETPVGGRFVAAVRAGTVEMLDSTGPWILLGLAVAAAVSTSLSPSFLDAVPAAGQVPLAALLGMPLYVCASGATPLVAALLGKGISAGAALAFLLTGPATNATTYGVLSRLHGRRTAIFFGAAMVVTAVGLGYLVDAVIPVDSPGEHHEHDHGGASPLAWGALGVLALLAFLSLLRQGPRGFVGQVLPTFSSHDHDHDHDHGDDHGPHDSGGGSSGGGCCHGD